MSDVILSKVRKHFGPEARAIDDLDLQVRDGELLVLLGPSGCGKSTTLRCVAGLEQPDAGRISIGGTPVVDADRGVFVPPEKRRLGMVFQSYALWPHMTVRQNVAYPLKVRGAGRAEQARGVDDALGLAGLEGLADRYPSELSGGQQQRVALARAVAARPRLLLFDEPLSNLDAQLRIRLRYDLRRIHVETGRTALYVTHDQSEALALADRVAVLNAGRIEQLGEPSDIFLSPRTRFVAEFVGFDNILPGRATADGAGAKAAVDGLPFEIAGRAAPGLVKGQAADVAVRSTGLTILPDGAAPPEGEATRFKAVLRSVAYGGDRYHGVIEVGGVALQGVLPLDRWGPGRERDRGLVGSPVEAVLPASEALILAGGAR